ncbi:MAG: T9SS type A sorting domain-containing protein [Bacteroidia bacterium]|nr:T9SS type A sorting domain-containing protein [Bacteroidia bacterium]
MKIKSQSFPSISDNPSWKVGVWNFFTANCEAYNWKYGGTVNICGKTYIEAIECDYLNSNCQTKGYIRINGKRVYIRKTTSCVETEKLMYDFSISPVSDYTMAYNLGTYDSTIAKVTYTQSVNYQNVARLTQSITYTIDPPANNYSDNMYAIEGIGNDIHPFFPLICFGDFCETNLKLIEYKQNNILLYSKNPVFPIACNNWVGINELKNDFNVQLFPNPTEDLLNVVVENTGKYTITIIDSYGKILIEQPMLTVKETIDVSHLSSGLYILQLKNENNFAVASRKIVKK